MNGIIQGKDILESPDHLFACKDNENEKKSQNVSSDNKNKKINKKKFLFLITEFFSAPKKIIIVDAIQYLSKK